MWGQNLGNQNNNANPNNDIVVNTPPTDSISSLSWSPTANVLVASSWDKNVRCWVVDQSGGTQPKSMASAGAPVLCTDFMDDGTKVFFGGCDKTCKLWDLATNQCVAVAQHDAPIKECFWIKENKLLVTGSWDKTLRYWDTRSPQPALSVTLPERVYSMDVKHPLVVVATANRYLVIYNLAQPQKPFRQYESPLKMQSRVVACFNDKTGFALGSIEGRVGIQHVEEKSKKNFAFKCHRQNDEVYAVNSICFHPMGTFATAGSDGTYVFWDKDSKQRLKMFKKCNNSITASKFNRDGTIFAYALSYDWSKGATGYDKNAPNSILLHAVRPEEITPRNK